MADGPEELSPRVLETVLRDFPTTSQDRPFWAPRLQVAPFAAGIAIGAATVALVVGMVGAGLLGRINGGAGTTPTASPSSASAAPPIDRSYRDVGYIGLPPRGATPSDQTPTGLVETFWLPRRGGPFYSGAAFLYADGRLIWNEYVPAQPLEGSTGWLEQRLTTEGIALVRALAAESTDGRPRRLDPAELPGQLPDDAWLDRTVRPYIASEYAACLNVSDQENPFLDVSMTLPKMLSALPRPASDLLRGHPHVPYAEPNSPEPLECLLLDLAAARRLDAALREAGAEQDESWNRYQLEYHVVLDRAEGETPWLQVLFEPVLPDGTITCSGCG